jgi:hypothetical protein
LPSVAKEAKRYWKRVPGEEIKRTTWYLWFAVCFRTRTLVPRCSLRQVSWTCSYVTEFATTIMRTVGKVLKSTMNRLGAHNRRIDIGWCNMLPHHAPEVSYNKDILNLLRYCSYRCHHTMKTIQWRRSQCVPKRIITGILRNKK